MQLKDDENGWNVLRITIQNYYSSKNRVVSFFSEKESEAFEVQFLVDKKHVIKYVIGVDRDIPLGVLLLAIGPHYFSASEFWDRKNADRFTLESSTDGVVRNLMLLDEFFESQS